MDKCTENTKRKLIVLKEEGKIMIFHNRKEQLIKITQVDGCAIKNGIRCDYLVKDNNDYEFYVELKGNDVIHACNQIETSIKKLSKDIKDGKKHSFIVPTRVFPAITTILQNRKLMFKRNYNCILIVKNNKCEFDLLNVQ